MSESLTAAAYNQSATKRRLDLYGGLVLASLATAPSVVLAGVAAVDTRSRQPVFHQTRRALDGTPIKTLKIRTLRGDPASNAAQTYGAHDPRASKVGRFFRNYGLDEMGQVLNVIRGNMSLVGIRPYLDPDLERMRRVDPILFDEWFAAGKPTKSGIFGTSQLERRSYRVATCPAADVMSMRSDLAYLTETASLATDLRILATTPLKLAFTLHRPLIEETIEQLAN